MLVINGLKSTTSLKSFEDFNNMFRAIDPQNYTSIYIAILVLDKVVLERDPIRTNEVNTWFDGKWYPQCQQRQYEFSSDEESLSNITD